MMYRCGYSYKDDRQTCVLAIKVSHEGFSGLLENARLSAHGEKDGKKESKVVVQWDPERSWRNAKMDDVRSIQIGIGPELTKQWIEEWVMGIEDVTDTARTLKKELDMNKNVTEEELRKKQLLAEERPYEVPDHVRKLLKMD